MIARRVYALLVRARSLATGLSQEGRGDHRNRVGQGPDRGRHRSAIRWRSCPEAWSGWLRVDAPEAVRLAVRAEAAHDRQRRAARCPTSAGFDPARDLQRAYVGFYSMRGRGHRGGRDRHLRQGKDRARGRKHAEDAARRAGGEEHVRRPHAVHARTTSASSCLTQHTVLFGNETGMRRALDRIKEGRVARQVPSVAARAARQAERAAARRRRPARADP